MAFKFSSYRTLLVPIVLTSFVSACSTTHKTSSSQKTASVPIAKAAKTKKTTARVKAKYVKPKVHNTFGNKLSAAAKERTKHHVVYDGRYVKLNYPWGDVPSNIGVCTDVVIRSYRRLGIDLQQQVHKDMLNGFDAYPNLSKWKLKGPDSNIDHRRVYNLRAFFKRHGQSLPPSYNPNHFKPGDLVTWQVGPGQGHIGIVVNQKSKQDPKRYLVVHNIAEGPKMEDVLFRFRMTGHYRYSGHMKYYRPTQYAKADTALRAARASVSLPGIGVIPPELLR